MKKFKKKSVALFATMMVATAAAGYVYQQNQAEESALNELAMANVEALADGEDTTTIQCDPMGSVCHTVIIKDQHGGVISKTEIYGFKSN